MDPRISEICHLLPGSRYANCLLSGFSDSRVIRAFREKVQHLQCGGISPSTWSRNTFDLIFFQPSIPCEPSVAPGVYAALRDGGTAVVLVPTGYVGPLCQKIMESQKPFLKHDSMLISGIYGLTPSLEEIRLAVPLENKACASAALALYQPSLFNASCRKQLAYLLGRMGLARLWAPYAVVLVQKGQKWTWSGLPWIIRKTMKDNVLLALFTGTPGYLRKSTVQIMDDGGSILGYCKTGDTPQTKSVLQNEAVSLQYISSLALGNALTPTLLHAEESDNGTYHLVQSSRKKPLSSAPLVPDDRHQDFLTRIMEQTKIPGIFRESACHREVAKRLDDVGGTTASEYLPCLREAFSWSSEVLHKSNVILHLAHRDFTPWNTFITNGRLYVFDWEFARTGWTPLTDAFHFILQKGILVDRRTPEELWCRLTSEKTREGQFIHQCTSHVKASKETFLALLAFYLCDIMTMYIDYYEREGSITQDGKRLLTAWEQLLKMILDLKGPRH